MTEAIDRFTGSNHFLSNFHPVRMKYESVLYPSSEHAFQAAKTLKPELRARMAKIGRPAEAKRFGRTLVLRPGWERMKNDVMLEVLRIKFKNPLMKRLLLETGDAELIESNDWRDDYWGVYRGHGQNWLGKLLMQVRKELQT